MIYRYTALREAQNPQGELKEVESFEDLAYFVQHARDRVRKNKKDGPGICAPMKGGRRQKINVLPRNWISLDIDGPRELNEEGKPVKIPGPNGKDVIKPSLGISDEAIGELRAVLKGKEYFMHPSFSDKPEKDGRGRKVRVFLSLDKELPAPEWETTAKNLIAYLEEKVPQLRAAERLTCSIDPASTRAEQFMFTCPKEKAAFFEFHKGEPIKTIEYLNQARQNNPTAKDYKPRLKNPRHDDTASAQGFSRIDPILETLKDKGLYIRSVGAGKHAVKCPSEEHEDGAETSTVYYEPGSTDDTGKTYRYGAFKCMHQTCSGRRTGDFFKLLGIDYEQYTAEIDADLNRDPNYFRAGGRIYKTVGGEVFVGKTNAKGDTSYSKYFPEIEILGLTRDVDSADWGRLIRFKDFDHKEHTMFLSNAALTGNGEEVREQLTGLGFSLYKTGAGVNRALCDYIYMRPLGADPNDPEKEKPRILRTVSAGWLSGVFVTPEKIYGQTTETIFYEAEKKRQANYQQKGTLDGWRDAIAYPAQFSSNLTLAICTALAAPLVRLFPTLIEQTSAGFHFFGESGTGKTTILRAAASVWGRPDDDEGGRIARWTDTANELEFIAAAHNDSLLCLDELTGADARETEQKIYRLSGNKLKARANKDLSRSANAAWRVLLISTGEEALEKTGARENFEIRSGALSRLISLRAGSGLTTENGEALGVFETIPTGLTSAKAAYERLSDGYLKHYGTAGDKWLEYLTSSRPQLLEEAEKLDKEFFQLVPEQLGHQQRRELKRFCVCAIAGELATQAGITGWTAGYALKAITARAARYMGTDTAETKEVRRFIDRLRNGAEDLSNYAPINDPSRSARCGYRNFDGNGTGFRDDPGFSRAEDPDRPNLEVQQEGNDGEQIERRLILRNDYFRQVIGNLDEKKAAAVLEDKGLLVMKNKGKGRSIRRKLRVKVAGSAQWRYVLNYDNLMNLDDLDEEND